MLLVTLGDSILDCGHYNAHGVHPAGLLVRNDDALFPEFRGRDLARHGVRLHHGAVDGATVEGLAAQVRRVPTDGPAVVLLTVGGNDLLRGLLHDDGRGLARFRERLDAALDALPPWPVLVGNVYDPTFGDDARNFTGADPRVAREAHRRMNETLADVARRRGALVDVHAHFLHHGDPSWFTRVIEPSLTGASELRRVFLPHAEEIQRRRRDARAA